MNDPPLILIVDDEPDCLLLIDDLVNSLGYRTLCAANGGEARQCLSGNRVDAVLLDAMLPDCSGYDICRHLRRQPGHEYTPAIIMSGLDESEQRHDAACAGANGILSKPFHLSHLSALLKRLTAASVSPPA